MKPKKDNLFECSAVTRGIEIELTSYCSMNCVVCARQQLKHHSYMSFDNFKKIIDLLKQGNYKEIMVCGLGDAFIHKEINKFMDYLFSEIPSINLFFMTKGLSINDSHLDKIKELNQKGYNVSITFSVFSLDEKIYNYLTGGNFYKSFIKVLNKVSRLKINYSMEFMLSVINIGELNKFKKFATTLGKDYGISLVHNWGGKIPKNIHEKMFDENILKGYYLKREKNELCEVMKYDYLYINSSGEVFQCSLNEIDRRGYLGMVGECSLTEFLKKKNTIDYKQACRECFYFNYKTFN